jgi:muramidase (phage lysozyme)/uncharacterized membrane protein YgcG
MFKSFINPEKIIGNGTKAVSPEAFSNFMLGKESSLGKSVLNSATNNISDFSKKGISVDTSSNIAPLIQNISTSIVNNVDNSISNTLNSFKTEIQTLLSGVQQQVQSNLASVIQNFSKDYQQRIQSKDDNKPSNILKGFLGLYQNAIDFVSFFGDSRNNKKIETSLKSLRSMFDESFNTAIVIRQVINKIVKQLSNLPTATGNAGPLNLDVSVPGGRLKQAGGATIGKFLKGRGGQLLGAGVVGAGALGMMSMQAARASQEEKLAETAKKGVGGEDKPNEFMKGLDNIIERFSDAIDGLLGGKKKGSSGGGGGSASSGGGSTNGGGGSTPDGGVGEISTSGEGTPEQQAMLKSLRFAEGTSKSYGTIFGGNTVKELEEGKLTVQETINMADTGKLPQRLGGGTVPGYGKGSKATGAYQFMPGTLEGLIKNGSLKGDELFTNKVQDRAALQLATNRGVTADLLKKEGFSANVSNKLAPEWASIPVLNGKSYYGQPVKTLKELQNVYKQSLNITPSSVITPQTAQKPPAATPAPRPISRVEPAPNPKAREVSQAITGQNAKNNVEVASLPPNITVIPGGESQNRGGVVPLSPPSGDAPDVSMYGSTGNPNNPNPYTSLILGMSFA